MIRLMATKRDGDTIEVEADIGRSLMETLRDQNVDVEGVCGGMVSCASCHIYMDEKTQKNIPAPEEMETFLLEELIHTKPNSRLCCQIILTEKCDGLVFEIAPDEF